MAGLVEAYAGDGGEVLALAEADEDPILEDVAEFVAAGFEGVRVGPGAFAGADFAEESFVIWKNLVLGLAHGGVDVFEQHGIVLLGKL
jgi:hypothetical protein